MSLREPGKKRIKLAQLLTEDGYTTDPWDLYPITVWSRSSHRMDNDSFRWEGNCDLSNGVRVHLYSYYTMTELIRTGITVEHHKDMPPLWYEVFPKKEKP